MTNKIATKLAHEAGAHMCEHGIMGVTAMREVWEFKPDELNKFVGLVEKALLERLANHFDKHEWAEIATDEVVTEIRSFER